VRWSHAPAECTTYHQHTRTRMSNSAGASDSSGNGSSFASGSSQSSEPYPSESDSCGSSLPDLDPYVEDDFDGGPPPHVEDPSVGGHVGDVFADFLAAAAEAEAAGSGSGPGKEIRVMLPFTDKSQVDSFLAGLASGDPASHEQLQEALRRQENASDDDWLASVPFTTSRDPAVDTSYSCSFSKPVIDIVRPPAEATGHSKTVPQVPQAPQAPQAPSAETGFPDLSGLCEFLNTYGGGGGGGVPTSSTTTNSFPAPATAETFAQPETSFLPSADGAASPPGFSGLSGLSGLSTRPRPQSPRTTGRDFSALRDCLQSNGGAPSAVPTGTPPGAPPTGVPTVAVTTGGVGSAEDIAGDFLRAIQQASADARGRTAPAPGQPLFSVEGNFVKLPSRGADAVPQPQPQPQGCSIPPPCAAPSFVERKPCHAVPGRYFDYVTSTHGVGGGGGGSEGGGPFFSAAFQAPVADSAEYLRLYREYLDLKLKESNPTFPQAIRSVGAESFPAFASPPPYNPRPHLRHRVTSSWSPATFTEAYDVEDDDGKQPKGFFDRLCSFFCCLN
jgi:hypothetical protein